MPGYNDTISIPYDLDGARPTEELRRVIYDAAYQLTFIEASMEEQEDLPGYSPEMCQFTVFWVFGRWFAVWWDLETDEDHDLPLCRRSRRSAHDRAPRKRIGLVLIGGRVQGTRPFC